MNKKKSSLNTLNAIDKIACNKYLREHGEYGLMAAIDISRLKKEVLIDQKEWKLSGHVKAQIMRNAFVVNKEVDFKYALQNNEPVILKA